ncbi:hypothetical protein Pelo_11459 [Pelomyxa schiedti]|nr:hypothetical protein Pelo_11459 [Pelomyxa schiedti]
MESERSRLLRHGEPTLAVERRILRGYVAPLIPTKYEREAVIRLATKGIPRRFSVNNIAVYCGDVHPGYPSRDCVIACIFCCTCILFPVGVWLCQVDADRRVTVFVVYENNEKAPAHPPPGEQTQPSTAAAVDIDSAPLQMPSSPEPVVMSGRVTGTYLDARGNRVHVRILEGNCQPERTKSITDRLDGDINATFESVVGLVDDA